MAESTPAENLARLRTGEAPAHERYALIHGLGRAGYSDAIPTIEGFLDNQDPQLRYIALEVLTHHFYLDRHWETARRFLERDPDLDCRCMGAAAIGALRRDSRDRRSLVLLAQIVADDSAPRLLRESAYRAMRSVIAYDPREQFKLAARGLDLERDLDWQLVRSYLP
jgi:hypothetical protein